MGNSKSSSASLDSCVIASSAPQPQCVVHDAPQGNLVITPFGVGRLFKNWSGTDELVQVSLPFGVGYLNADVIEPFPLVSQVSGGGYALKQSDEPDADSIGMWSWGSICVQNSTWRRSYAVTDYDAHSISVSTPYGDGVLIHKPRHDGLLDVQLKYATAHMHPAVIQVWNEQVQEKNIVSCDAPCLLSPKKSTPSPAAAAPQPAPANNENNKKKKKNKK